MDESAIRQIQKQEATVEVNAAIRTALDTMRHPVAALPGDYGVQDLERYMDRRARFRGIMKAATLQSFVAYAEANGEDEGSVFIDRKAMRALAFLNLGSVSAPGHGDHVASLQLEPTSEYQALLDVHQSTLSQRELIDWMEDWSHVATFFDQAGEALEFRRAVGCIRRMTIEHLKRREHEVEDFRESASAMEQVEAKSSDTLVAGFRYHVQPFEAFGERDFDVRLSIRTGGSAPMLVPRIRRLDGHREEMAEEFAEIITARLPGVVCLQGSFSP